MKAPDFWQAGHPSFWSKLLSPLGLIYGHQTSKRARRAPAWKAPIPVICIGNLTMGGAGKTPTASKIAQTLKDTGHKPVFLSRGYGGTISGPVMVNDHTSEQVGDEPLLLSTIAPVCVSHDRIAGAKICSTGGFDAIIMDDGFQNPHLSKDLSLLVVDGAYGHGNEQFFPAGPMRESLKSGCARAQAVVMIGEDGQHQEAKMKAANAALVFQASRLQAVQPAVHGPVIAFAGIGRPEKFFQTVQDLNLHIAEKVAFADHHPFSQNDLDRLQHLAQKHDAQLLTTEKDFVRLPENFRKQVATVKITLEWHGEDMLKPMLTRLFED